MTLNGSKFMTIYHLSYLFDHLGFLEIMSPIIPQLERGEYTPLLKLAENILSEREELWETLNYLNQEYSFEDEYSFRDEGEGLNPQTLLMKVLVNYWEDIEAIGGNYQWLEVALPALGWSTSEVRDLLHGENICTLLIPDRQLPKYDGSLERPWCATYAGWLHPTRVGIFRKKLLDSQITFMEMAHNPPQSIQKKFNPFEKAYIKEGKLFSEWFSEGLIDAYKYIQRVYNTAYEEKKSLSLALSI